jgi:mannose-1-phosphate guanylyltransferase
MRAMQIVILAGGGGTRLRPLSTAERPKPFLPLLPTGETLLQRTIARLAGPELAGADVSVLVAAGYAPLVARQARGVEILVEPEGRNTAAAIALAALAGSRPDEEVMVVLPADHRIEPEREGGFRTVLRDAADGLATGAFGIESPLVTLGVQVTRPATEFGYLLPDAARGEPVHGLQAYPLAAFEEKPTRARADELRVQPGVAWNAGMFLWRRRAIRSALERHAPEVLAAVRGGLDRGDLASAYAGLRARSIDYEVMEPAAAAGHVVMAAMDVGWSDVGTWAALLEVLGASGIEGRVVEVGESIAPTPADLVVRRTAGGCVVVPGDGATMTAAEPIALLRDARPHAPLVGALLERCARWEEPS